MHCNGWFLGRVPKTQPRAASPTVQILMVPAKVYLEWLDTIPEKSGVE